MIRQKSEESARNEGVAPETAILFVRVLGARAIDPHPSADQVDPHIRVIHIPYETITPTACASSGIASVSKGRARHCSGRWVSRKRGGLSGRDTHDDEQKSVVLRSLILA
jgi:hypothetical protein